MVVDGKTIVWLLRSIDYGFVFKTCYIVGDTYLQKTGYEFVFTTCCVVGGICVRKAEGIGFSPFRFKVFLHSYYKNIPLTLLHGAYNIKWDHVYGITL